MQRIYPKSLNWDTPSADLNNVASSRVTPVIPLGIYLQFSDDVKERPGEVRPFRVAWICHVIRCWPHRLQERYRPARGGRCALHDADKSASLRHSR